MLLIKLVITNQKKKKKGNLMAENNGNSGKFLEKRCIWGNGRLRTCRTKKKLGIVGGIK